MFSEDFLSFNLVELFGLAVTIVGIWIVVRQLTESRLASQMEGAIAFADRSDKLDSEIADLLNFSNSEDWENLDFSATYSTFKESPKYFPQYLKMANLYGLVGGLVRARALDISLADEGFGYYLPKRWRRFEKYTKELRKNSDNFAINEDWEWLAKEFEKMNR